MVYSQLEIKIDFWYDQYVPPLVCLTQQSLSIWRFLEALKYKVYHDFFWNLVRSLCTLAVLTLRVRPVNSGVRRKDVRKDTPFGHNKGGFYVYTDCTVVQLLPFPLIAKYRTLCYKMNQVFAVEHLSEFPFSTDTCSVVLKEFMTQPCENIAFKTTQSIS